MWSIVLCFLISPKKDVNKSYSTMVSSPLFEDTIVLWGFIQIFFGKTLSNGKF